MRLVIDAAEVEHDALADQLAGTVKLRRYQMRSLGMTRRATPDRRDSTGKGARILPSIRSGRTALALVMA